MKHTQAVHLLSRELLCFVRDHIPTGDEFMARFGGVGGQTFHILRKAEALVVQDDRVQLNPRHLSSDAMSFAWGNTIFRLDRDAIMLVRWGPNESSVSDPD